MKIVRVDFVCEKCGKPHTTTNHNLRYRDHNKDEHICFKCLLKMQKSSEVFNAIPVEYHNQIFAGCIDYDLAIRYLVGVSSKVLVKFECRQCTQHCLIRWSKLADRAHNKYDNICAHCLRSLINNDPIMLESNRQKTKLLWNDDNYRTKCLKAFASHNKAMQTDQEYANRHRRKSHSVAGTILINGQWIRFDSGFELIFLWNTRDRYVKIRRCDFVIAYGKHFYHPDFFVIDKSGRRSIIEIKGYYRNNVEQKQEAATRYIADTGIADSYDLYDTDRLMDDGIILGVGGTYMWDQIRRINNGTTITFSDPKHSRIAEIGQRRYYREIANQKNI